MKSIEGAGLRAAELVRQLLYFSRKVDAERKPLDLNEEVVRAHRLLERTIPKMIDIQLRLPDGLWSVNADPIQIEQVLLNLGTNAADAMPGGGRLEIATENVELERNSEIAGLGLEPGRYVRVSVSDTGQGIDSKTQEHIFEPFFTTKGIGKGTGLGLASVFGIVKGHLGSISCSSQVGRGTRFDIYLPAAAAKADLAADASAGDRVRGGTETVLLVDDDPHISNFASEALTQYGYSILTASSGEEALDVYSRRSREIDLVIMDIGMPGMGGHRCLQELLRIDRAAKVLIASGYALDGQVRQSLNDGAAGYVGKPYHLKDLLGAVRTVLDREG